MIVGIKSGCYTLFHGGHFWMLEECGKQCDYLIALTNNDEYVVGKKGFVPLPAEERRLILSCHKYVKEAHIFNGKNEDDWINDFYHSVLTRRFGRNSVLHVFHSEELKGDTWLPGEAYSDKIIFIPKQSSPFKNSVTSMCNKIRWGL